MTMHKADKGGVDRVDIRGQVEGLQLEAVQTPPPQDSVPKSDTLPRRRGAR